MQFHKQEKTALLFGATGLVGGHLLELLLLSANYSKVHSFGRRQLEISHPKLEQHLIDFDELEDYKSLLQGDDCFCCLGTTMAKAGGKEAFAKVDYHYVYEIAKLTSRNKVGQFLLVSAVGADKDSLFFYNRVKGKAEAAVKDLPFWAVHLFQPSLLLGERNDNRFGEKLSIKLMKVLDPVIGGLISKYRPIEADTVAKAMLSAAQGTSQGEHVYTSRQLNELALKADLLRLN